MVREPDATMQPTLQDNQLMSKHRVLGFKPQLRLEWRGQDGQNEAKQPDHSASLGDFITSSTRIRFSVHTTLTNQRAVSGETDFNRRLNYSCCSTLSRRLLFAVVLRIGRNLAECSFDPCSVS
jgi:hypothetical protein